MYVAEDATGNDKRELIFHIGLCKVTQTHKSKEWSTKMHFSENCGQNQIHVVCMYRFQHKWESTLS
jgi:hypothetical protein